MEVFHVQRPGAPALDPRELKDAASVYKTTTLWDGTRVTMRHGFEVARTRLVPTCSGSTCHLTAYYWLREDPQTRAQIFRFPHHSSRV